MKTDFVCPKCRGELCTEGNSKRCALGHTYDRARAGYYNLLLGASGGTHGDNRDMVSARTRFLSAGYYSPLRDRLAEVVSGLACERASLAGAGVSVLDCGCGEGYYTEGVLSALLSRAFGADSSLLAFDISKDAVASAARRARGASFAVASCYDIPVASGAIDIAYNVFSPLAPEEMRRVIASGGYFVAVYPDRRHLFELKAAIYDNPYENEPQGGTIPGFELQSREKIAYDITLPSSSAVCDLFMMTPYAYRTGEKERTRLGLIENLTTRVEFILDIYRRD